MASVFIGLDLGAKCGWAVIDGYGELFASGTWKLGSLVAERVGALIDHLCAIIDSRCDPPSVSYEKVRRHLGTDAAHAYGAYEGVVHWVCGTRGIVPIKVEVSNIKRTATGKGNAKKHEMVAAAKARWGVDASEDEADALWIAECARLLTYPSKK